MKLLAILGRQPAIGIAELEALYGSEAVKPIGNKAVEIDATPDKINFARLGGSMKLGKLLTVLETADWNNIETYLETELPKHANALPEGKLTFGLSVYGFSLSPKKINATALSIKKIVRATKRSVRIIPNKSAELSSAQVLHNKLFTSHNWELLLVKDGSKTYLAQTTAIQDIEAYAARDQARPARDARVGMLPPKLAQILVNLAVTNTDPKYGSVVLDPFCGTGVVLQEALLMGYDFYGTDLETRMIEYSQKNLLWLSKQTISPVDVQTSDGSGWKLEVADATTHTWSPLPNFIACETYLGRPFQSEPNQQTLNKVIQDVDTIHQKFLENVARQMPPGTRLCIAVPAWKFRNQFKHLKTLDHLKKLGYTRVSFAHVDNQDLIYYREGQVVGRELVVLERN